MLVLSRRCEEQIVLPDCGVVFTVLEVRGDKVRIGITAPPDVQVHRREVWERILREQQTPGGERVEITVPAGHS